MRKVFPSREVVHIWANQSQGEARSNNVFFEGRVIYSYGKHFPMACFHGNIVLISSDKYSVTTAKHVSWVNRSIPYGITKFFVPSICGSWDLSDIDHEKNMKYFDKQIHKLLVKASTARSNKPYLLNDAASDQNTLREYIAAFYIKDVPAAITETLGIDISINNDLLNQIKEIEKVKRQAVLNEKKEKIERWLAGDDVWINGVNKTFLRLVGDDIETSHGAKVAEREARILYNFIETGRDIKGFKIGYYTTIGMKDNELQIGCHKIEKTEIDRFAKVMNW